MYRQVLKKRVCRWIGRDGACYCNVYQVLPNSLQAYCLLVIIFCQVQAFQSFSILSFETQSPSIFTKNKMRFPDNSMFVMVIFAVALIHGVDGFLVRIQEFSKLRTFAAATKMTSCSTDSNNNGIAVANKNTMEDSLVEGRRHFLSASIAAVVSTAAIMSGMPMPALADDSIPMVTTSEFENILKSSARSVQLVQFSGPKGETAVVKLVDGTTFGISDVIESAVDPRSPLKLVSTLRGYNVPYKFSMLEAAVGSASTRGQRKVYLNEATIIANKKTEDKMERMAKDEEDRLEAVQKMKNESR
jgi:hypothetical protein